MVRHYGYNNSQREVLSDVREILESQGYKIIEYAPEDGFMFTDYKINYWGKNQFQFAVAVHIKDKITITGMGKLDLPISGMGDAENIMKTQSLDRLPYRLQRHVFTPIDSSLNSLGYYEINHWP